MVETPRLNLLQNIPGASPIVERGLLSELHTPLCCQGKFGKAAKYYRAQLTGEMFQHPELPWSTNERGNYCYLCPSSVREQ